MTPPFYTIQGQWGLPDLEPLRARLPHRQRAQGEAQILGSALDRSRDVYAERGSSALPRSEGERAPEVFSTAVDQALQRARGGDLAQFVTALNILAAQQASASETSEQESLQARAREIAEQSMQSIESSRRPTRDKMRALYDMVFALSPLLAIPQQPVFAPTNRDLLQRIFERISSGVEQVTMERIADPRIDPTPIYWETFARGHRAMLDGRREEAYLAFLQTQRLARTHPLHEQRGSFTNQMLASTEIALATIPGDTSHLAAESTRTRAALEALLYFHHVDQQASLPEHEFPVIALQIQGFNMMAELLLQREPTLTASDMIARLRDIRDADQQYLLHALQTLSEQSGPIQEALNQMRNSRSTEALFRELVSETESIAQRIHEKRGQTPYATVLRRDGESRQIRRATQELARQESLQVRLRELFHLGAGVSPEAMVCELTVHPERLQILPQSIRQNRDYQTFFTRLEDALHTADHLESSLDDLLQSIIGLSRDDDHYAAAYLSFFESMGANEADIPEDLRTLARHAGEELQSFSGRRIARHMISGESIGMIVGGTILAEALPIGFLWLAGRGARAGNLGFRIWRIARAGELTFRGEMTVGLGVGAALWAGGLIPHLLTTDRPAGEEFVNALPGLVVSSLALAATMGLGHYARRWILPSGVRPTFGRLAALRGINMGAGTMFMAGGSSVAHGIATDDWSLPGAEETAEIFLTIAAWDLFSAGIGSLGQRWRWRMRLGATRSQVVEGLLRQMGELNPALKDSSSQRFLRNYLGLREVSGQGTQEIARNLDGGLHPYLEAVGPRQVLRFRTALPPFPPPPSPPQTPKVEPQPPPHPPLSEPQPQAQQPQLPPEPQLPAQPQAAQPLVEPSPAQPQPAQAPLAQPPPQPPVPEPKPPSPPAEPVPPQARPPETVEPVAPEPALEQQRQAAMEIKDLDIAALERYYEIRQSPSNRRFEAELESIRRRLESEVTNSNPNPETIIRVRLAGDRIELIPEANTASPGIQLRFRPTGFIKDDLGANVVDPVLRVLLERYTIDLNRRLRIPPAPGMEIGRRADDTEQTGVHRPIAPVEESAGGSGAGGGGSKDEGSPGGGNQEGASEDIVFDLIDDPATEPQPVVVPAAPPQPLGLSPVTTAQFNPSEALLDKSRRPSLAVTAPPPSSLNLEGSGQPPKGEPTVRITTGQSAALAKKTLPSRRPPHDVRPLGPTPMEASTREAAENRDEEDALEDSDSATSPQIRIPEEQGTPEEVAVDSEHEEVPDHLFHDVATGEPLAPPPQPRTQPPHDSGLTGPYQAGLAEMEARWGANFSELISQLDSVLRLFPDRRDFYVEVLPGGEMGLVERLDFGRDLTNAYFQLRMVHNEPHPEYMIVNKALLPPELQSQGFRDYLYLKFPRPPIEKVPE